MLLSKRIKCSDNSVNPSNPIGDIAFAKDNRNPEFSHSAFFGKKIDKHSLREDSKQRKSHNLSRTFAPGKFNSRQTTRLLLLPTGAAPGRSEALKLKKPAVEKQRRSTIPWTINPRIQ